MTRTPEAARVRGVTVCESATVCSAHCKWSPPDYQAHQTAVKRRGIAARCNALLGSAIMLHSYGYTSLFVSTFDVPVSLSNLFQGKALVDDCFELPGLDQLFDEN
jgi:hypothetical protein